jgi:nicotinamide-nucleotide amidase
MIELLAIGDELLLGETVDTNSAWIARCLAAEGIAVQRVTAVGDDIAAIRAALDSALRRCRVVICTGGLGPTPDDMTRHAVAALYDRRLVVDETWIDVLQERHRRRGIAMPERNRVQAERPDGALLLPNELGSAPGVAIDDDARGLTILLPGVPLEVRGLMEAQVLPLLRARLVVAGRIESRLVRTVGIAEASLAERIADIEEHIVPLKLAFLPHGTGVDLRFTGSSDAVERLFDGILARLRERIGDHIYACDGTDLATVVGGMLRDRGLTLALAESCTGGLVARRLTDAPGASDYLLAGFITYSNEAKQDLIGVDAGTLATYGAVSDACAREMAEGARRVGRADVGVAITGVAGPGGGSEEKPVGTVWIAVAAPAGTETRHFIIAGDRTAIRERAGQAALDLLRRVLRGTRSG